MSSPKVALISLGCTKNLVDSEKILGRMVQGGAVLCQDPSTADTLIINTCGFIKEAKEESIDTILQMAKLKEEAHLKKLIVTGCLAQRYQEDLLQEIPEIDHVVGLERLDSLVQFTGLKPSNGSCHEEKSYSIRLTPRHYAYLKISEGCDNRCSYCAIPAIRGAFRSRPLENLLQEARQLVETGAREINIIAQDSTLYGIDLYGRQRLHELLQGLSEIRPLRWIRLLYTHPAHFYPALVREIAKNEKVVKYIDLPIQHINDNILRKMGRGINRRGIEELIDGLRKEVPGLFLRTTVIVGFPGEGEEEYKELLGFLEKTAFERLGAFCYSREEGTVAASMKGSVPQKIKRKRLKGIMGLQQRITFEQNARWVGRGLEVLIEGPCREEEANLPGVGQAPYHHGAGQAWLARFYGDAPEADGNVVVYGSGLAQGEFRRVSVILAEGYNLVARCVE